MLSDKQKYLIFSAIVALCYFFGFLVSHFYFMDDVYRSISGVFLWNQNGRPLTEYLFRLLSGEMILDLYPLTLIAGVMLIILSADRLRVQLFAGDVGCGVMATFLLLANPFLLTNASFRYDSVTMLASMAFAIWAISIHSQRILSPKILGITGLLLLVWTSYQPGICLYLVLNGVYYVHYVIFKQQSSYHRQVAQNIIALIISYLIYTLIAHALVSGTYSEYHSQLSPLNKAGLLLFIANIKEFLFAYHLLVMGHFRYLFELLFLGLYGCIIYLDYTYIRSKESSLNKLHSYLFLFSPILLILLTFLIFCLLKNPVIKYRVLLGFSGVLLYTFYILQRTFRFKKTLYLLSPIIGLLFIYSYSFTKSQDIRYDKYMETIHSIGILITSSSLQSNDLLVFNDLPRVPENRAVSKAIPFIDNALKSYFSGQYLVSDDGNALRPRDNLFRHDTLTLDLNAIFVSPHQLHAGKPLNPIAETPYFTLYIKGEQFVVVYKEKIAL